MTKFKEAIRFPLKFVLCLELGIVAYSHFLIKGIVLCFLNVWHIYIQTEYSVILKHKCMFTFCQRIGEEEPFAEDLFLQCKTPAILLSMISESLSGSLHFQSLCYVSEMLKWGEWKNCWWINTAFSCQNTKMWGFFTVVLTVIAEENWCHWFFFLALSKSKYSSLWNSPQDKSQQNKLQAWELEGGYGF